MSKFKNISISKLIDELLSSEEWKYTKNTATNEEFKKKLELTKEALKTINNDYFNQPLDPLDLDSLSIFSISTKNHVKLMSYLLENYKNNPSIIKEAMTAFEKDFSYGVISRTRSNEKGGVTDYSIKANASLNDVYSSRLVAERLAYIPKSALSKPQKSSIPLEQQYEDLVDSQITSEKFPNTADKLKELMLEETTNLRQDGTVDENFNEKLENIHSKVKVINHKNGNHTYTTIYKDEDGYKEKVVDLTNKREVYENLLDENQKGIINNLQEDRILLKNDGELITSDPNIYYTFESDDDSGLYLDSHSMDDSIRSKYGISVESDPIKEAKDKVISILEDPSFIDRLSGSTLTDDELLDLKDDEGDSIYNNDVSDDEIINIIREYQDAIIKSPTTSQVTKTNTSPTEQLLQNSNLTENIKAELKKSVEEYSELEGYSDMIDEVIDKLSIPNTNPESIISEFIDNIKKDKTLESVLESMDENLFKDDLIGYIQDIINDNTNTFNCK